MFKQPISGMVQIADSVLSKAVWKCLPVKIDCKSTDWLYATNFHWKVFPTRVSYDFALYNLK